MDTSLIRNVAIIAHVDHGKTTLVDGLLRQAGVFRVGQDIEERVMDSFDQERERGITIFSKNCSVQYKEYLINVVDTPGHADFGGQVERVLGSVEGALLIVDAFEGPMAQTRFVTMKALQLGLQIIVVVNKIDRPGCDPHGALDKVFDLFVDLKADPKQLDFRYIFASGREGYAIDQLEDEGRTLGPLFEAIVKHIPSPPESDSPDPLLLITSLDYSEYLGRLAVGKLRRGKLKVNQMVSHTREDGTVQKVRVQKILYPKGLAMGEIPEAITGQIISLSGIQNFTIGDTLSSAEKPEALPRIHVDPPTIAMRFMVNDGPLCGRDGGKFLTSNHIWERLEREALSDVALRIARTDEAGTFLVQGRGVLHISVLIERMRRDLFEFSVGRPQVITQEIDGQMMEPVESISVNVPDEYSGAVIEEISRRKGEMAHMQQEGGQVELRYDIPARGLIGLRTRLLSLSRGYAVFQQIFKGYEPIRGEIAERPTGSLISKESGLSVAYALWKLEDRGVLFIGPGEDVYPGMLVGEHSRPDDLTINVVRGKQLTNMRASGSDDNVTLTPHKKLSLEECLEFIRGDECVEITLKKYRLRKVILDPNARKRSA